MYSGRIAVLVWSMISARVEMRKFNLMLFSCFLSLSGIVCKVGNIFHNVVVVLATWW